MSNGAYSIVGPFMPLEFMRKGLSEGVTGWVFAVYSVAVIIFSPFMGQVIGKLGRRKTIICGLVLMGIAFIAFGAISYIENKTLFVLAALIARLCQGFASTFIQTTCYSIATNFFSENKG